jgi:hypothetical protein
MEIDCQMARGWRDVFMSIMYCVTNHLEMESTFRAMPTEPAIYRRYFLIV